MIVLGGVLGTAGQPLVEGVRESINLCSQPANAAVVEVRTAQLGLRADLMGAVAQACQGGGLPGVTRRRVSPDEHAKPGPVPDQRGFFGFCTW